MREYFQRRRQNCRLFGLHVKDMQLLIEVTVFGLSESITVPFYSQDAAVVVSGVCASESVSKMWMVYLCICIMSFGLVCVLRYVYLGLVYLYVHVFLCDCVSPFPTAVSLPLSKD